MPKICLQTDFKPVTVSWEDNKITNIELGGKSQHNDKDVLPFDEIIDYFKGKVVDFSHLKLDLTSYSPFSRKVLEFCQKIPYGELITYGELAIRMGHPKAYRAVGAALKNNRYPLIIPCHRVIGSGGKLGGFNAGPGWKKFLINWEKSHR